MHAAWLPYKTSSISTASLLQCLLTFSILPEAFSFYGKQLLTGRSVTSLKYQLADTTTLSR